MQRLGQIIAVNSQDFALKQIGDSCTQPVALAGDETDRQGGLIIVEVRYQNAAPGTQLSFTRPPEDYAANAPQYCNATPTGMPHLHDIIGNGSFHKAISLATVADMTAKFDAPVPPIQPATVTPTVTLTRGGPVTITIHISGLMIRLSTGTGTSAPWY